MALHYKNIIGTKVLPNRELIISSGNPSVDCSIGEGIQVGSIFLIEEDVNGGYAKVLLKYFIAEGIVTNHHTLFVSKDSNPQKFMKELPSVVTYVDKKESDVRDEDEMKIAWRYNNLSLIKSTMETNSQFGNNFDLEKKIDPKVLENSSISLFESALECPCDEATMYKELIQYIKKEINDNGFLNANQKNNVLRIAIESLGSPFWQNNHHTVEAGKEAFYLRNFILNLKFLLRSSCAVAFITIPTYLFEHLGTLHRMRSLVDVSVKLDTFAGTPRENISALKNYHGLFCITKLAAVKSLVGMEPRTYDLAFKMYRKKFVIEKLHLPPELQESSEREQDDTSGGCGSFRKSAIDF